MSKILLTGATGYIGTKLLQELLQQSSPIIVPIRAESPELFQARAQELLKAAAPSAKDQIQFINADLGNLCDLLESERFNIKQVIHNAAITAFNVEEGKANTVNRDASVSLMGFAQTCPSLERFLYVSTVYTSGMTAGSVKEEFFATKPEFANHYERSKWESEEALRTQFQDLPWNIARVATIIADNENGLVLQQNAIHNTLKLFYYGLISLIPGFKTTPIYLVEGDFVAKSLAQISERAPLHKIFHVCHDSQSAVQLEKFIDIAFEEFNRDEGFRARRLLKPLFTDEKSFDTLVSSMKTFGGSVLSQGLSSVAPFGKQLFIKKDIDNTNLVNFLTAYQRPDMEAIVARSCQHLSQTKFAKVK